ncbi:hypothetical protein BGZ83_004676 [Gryganskiella cystojenkinii]|nr:hypothetical protein BGZ83_004676 [Gryganskiella cystojenkinii]
MLNHQEITIMTLLDLPDEILCHLLTYAEDTDLQSLAITCKRLRSLTLDGPLRRHILLIRTPARLQSSLSFRPSRDTLARQNILRGMHIHQHIREGHYIGGDISVRSYQVSCRLERQMLSLRISRKLKSRPDWSDLVDRGLIPEEMFVQPEVSEVKEKWKVYQEQQKLKRRHSQHQQKEHRQSLSSSSQETEHRKEEAMDIEQEPEPEPELIIAPAVHAINNTKVRFFSDNMTLTLPSSPSSPSSMPYIPPPPEVQGNGYEDPQPHSQNMMNNNESPANRPRRQRKSISMVLVPKIELLRRAMDRDRLSRLVQKRPSPTELNQSPKTATVLHAYHLVAFSNTSPDLVPLTAQLSFLLRGERLSHWLFHGRPSLAVMLNERHILKTEVRTAWMVCPGVNKNVRFYEGLIQDRVYEQQMQALWQHQHQQQLPQHPIVQQ